MMTKNEIWRTIEQNLNNPNLSDNNKKIWTIIKDNQIMIENYEDLISCYQIAMDRCQEVMDILVENGVTIDFKNRKVIF